MPRGEAYEVVLARLRLELAEAKADWLASRASVLAELAGLELCRHHVARAGCRRQLRALRRRAYLACERFRVALDRAAAARATERN
jgi:hypothetical protein